MHSFFRPPLAPAERRKLAAVKLKLWDRVRHIEQQLALPIPGWLGELIDETKRLCIDEHLPECWSGADYRAQLRQLFDNPDRGLPIDNYHLEKWRKVARTYRNRSGRFPTRTTRTCKAAKRARTRRSRTTPTEKELRALELRSRGWSFRRTGAELGVTKQRAQQLVKSALQRNLLISGRSVKTQAMPSDHRGQPLIEARSDTESA
jgi:hypothetical protein